MITIWVDADACPMTIKEFIFKAAERLKIKTILVANQIIKIPSSPFIHFVQVQKQFDAADFYITQNLSSSDLVVTADILLAGEVVKLNAIAIDPRGKLYNQESIADFIAARQLMQTLREGRMLDGPSGPRPFDPLDKKKFAAMFEKQLNVLMKKTHHKTI